MTLLSDPDNDATVMNPIPELQPVTPDEDSVRPPLRPIQPAITPNQANQPGQATQPNQPIPQQPSQGQGQIVSNAGAMPQPDPIQDHPAVKRAGLMYSIAESLAGGKRYKESIDESGQRVLTPIKLGRGDIAMAIAMEAIAGSFSGLAA